MFLHRQQCFVMMPSGNHEEYKGGQEEAEFVYNRIIVPSVNTALGEGVTIIREVDSRLPGAITGAIITHIAESDLVIVDITGDNPNVFLELGIRYALRRHTTVLLRQKSTIVPFDIAAHRCIEYSPLFDGPEEARKTLTETLSKLSTQSTPQCDSLVFDALPQIQVNIPYLRKEEIYIVERSMPWSVYWERLNEVVRKIADFFKDGRYVPQVIIGITNGGAMFADLLVREAFPGKPVVSLWANRQDNEAEYFNNSLNEAIVGGIKKFTAETEGEVNILLVDDIVASGTTHKQAIKFLTSRLPTAKIRFLPLFSRNDKYFSLVRDHFLWMDPVFNMTAEEAKQIHAVEWQKLPYIKEIRSA